MSDLRELYQEVILDHNRQPRNFHAMRDATREAEGFNPLCGDKVKVFLKIENGRVADVSFQGSGCAISTASASLMTDAIHGRTLDEVEALFRRMHAMLTGDEKHAGDTSAEVDLGKLAVFEGVREFPMRVKCATLSWHTLHAALEGADQQVSTE